MELELDKSFFFFLFKKKSNTREMLLSDATYRTSYLQVSMIDICNLDKSKHNKIRFKKEGDVLPAFFFFFFLTC
jgi:hypothetical protein